MALTRKCLDQGGSDSRIRCLHKRMRTMLPAISLVLSISGCGQPLPPPPESRDRAIAEQRHTPADRTALNAELKRQYERWLETRPSSYQLTVSLGCMGDCGVPWTSRVDGLFVRFSSGGHRHDGSTLNPPMRTVGQLFTAAERAAGSDADEVEVAFDTRFGYPTRIHIDPWRNSADDETEYIATLEVLTGQPTALD